MAERIPPGRAGRLWLVSHLAAAHRGRELLDRKHQLLAREQERLAAIHDQLRTAWLDACADALQWSVRAAIVGGTVTTGLFAGAVAGRTTVTIVWVNTMGVRHADTASCVFPVLSPNIAVAGNAALLPAAAAQRKALAAAVDAAVVTTALRRIEAERQATGRRLRGLEHKRIPRLDSALHTLQLKLDESEREEQVVTRMARERLQT
jgi:V/A-type H+-transporting ATPase subunit D